jgi:hypothetical protein
MEDKLSPIYGNARETHNMPSSDFIIIRRRHENKTREMRMIDNM